MNALAAPCFSALSRSRSSLVRPDRSGNPEISVPGTPDQVKATSEENHEGSGSNIFAISRRLMPPGLAVLLSAGLLAVGGSPELHAQRETVGKSSDSPFELIAPGRTLTVIVPNREAEIRHAGGSVPSESSQIHRVLIRRFAEQHYLDVDWVQVDNWDALVPSLIAGKGDLSRRTSPSPSRARRRSPLPFPPIALASTSWCARATVSNQIGDLAGREIVIREQSSFWHVVQQARRTHSGNRCPFRTGAHAVGTTAGGHRRRSV